jgi:hypothetical protein
MRNVLRHVAERRVIINEHPLFEWMRTADIPIEERLALLPVMANFSMGFRDVNKWVLRYPHASGELERGINIHTFEDQTHSHLFLEDWRLLDLDKRLGWTASDTLWWLFLADANEAARRHGVYFLSLQAADKDDPLLRFAQSEVIEACGAVFFSHIAKLAVRYTEQTGVELPYLGPFHLARESGHMECEDLFEEQILDDGRGRLALGLVDAMFDVFTDTFDMWLHYASTYLAAGTSPRRPAICPVTAASNGGGSARPCTGGPVHDSQAPVERLLLERKARTARHPLFTWLKNRGPGMSALQALQRFFPMWAMDVMGYRDLNSYGMGYARAATELERGVNAWVAELTTHSVLYLNDWRELGLDELLGWTASQTLEFCYLDPHVEPHRRNIAAFTSLAANHADPLPRLWLMHALESSGDAFFEHTQVLAAETEALTGLRLDYAAGRHEIGGLPSAPPAPTAPVTFKDRAMTRSQADIVTGMIETVFDAIDEQFDISLDVALSNKFGIP